MSVVVVVADFTFISEETWHAFRDVIDRHSHDHERAEIENKRRPINAPVVNILTRFLDVIKLRMSPAGIEKKRPTTYVCRRARARGRGRGLTFISEETHTLPSSPQPMYRGMMPT